MPGAITPAAEVLLCHGPHAVTLRASLRAMVALDRYPGGLAGLFDQIARQSLTAIYATVRAAATDAVEAQRFLCYLDAKPLSQIIPEMQAACLALLAAALGPGQGEANHPQSTATQSKSFADYTTDLYRYATGWLGWTPSETWNASLDEITAAYEAHVDRLVMMTPGATKPDDTKPNEHQRHANTEAGLDPDFDRAGLHGLIGRHHL